MKEGSCPVEFYCCLKLKGSLEEFIFLGQPSYAVSELTTLSESGLSSDLSRSKP